MPDFEVNEDKHSLQVRQVLDYERNKASYNFVKSALLVNSTLSLDKSLAEAIEPEKISLNDINQAIRYIYSGLLDGASCLLYTNVIQLSTTNHAFAKYNNDNGRLKIGTNFKFYTSSGAGLTSSYIFRVTRLRSVLTIHTRNSTYVYTIGVTKDALEDIHFELSKEDRSMLDTLLLLQELYLMH